MLTTDVIWMKKSHNEHYKLWEMLQRQIRIANTMLDSSPVGPVREAYRRDRDALIAQCQELDRAYHSTVKEPHWTEM